MRKHTKERPVKTKMKTETTELQNMYITVLLWSGTDLKLTNLIILNTYISNDSQINCFIMQIIILYRVLKNNESN